MSAAELADLDAALQAHADPERAAHDQVYHKSDREHWGVAVPEMRRATLSWLRGLSGPRDPVAVAEAVWASPVFERQAATIEVLVTRQRRLTPADLPVLERLLRGCRSWALLDTLATKAIAPLAQRDSEAAGPTLDRWATDPDFWLQRAALLTLLPGMRAGEGDWARFTRWADPLLEEREFFLRKATGWVLREASKREPDRVASWLEARLDRVSGLTLREGSKNLPPADKARLLGAHRNRPAIG